MFDPKPASLLDSKLPLNYEDVITLLHLEAYLALTKLLKI